MMVSGEIDTSENLLTRVKEVFCVIVWQVAKIVTGVDATTAEAAIVKLALREPGGTFFGDRCSQIAGSLGHIPPLGELVSPCRRDN
jgi:hypothetical protein